MKWSLKIAQIAGIGIYLHWTFLVLLVWIAASHFSQGESLRQAAAGVAFVSSIFVCVVLHELGHALTAKAFGVQTRDITLLIIGGIARLEKIPEAPFQEFLVAIAGPAVNVVIAAMIFAVLAVGGAIGQVEHVNLVGGPFLAKLMIVNLILVLFNMIPAFPMDGGRILRSLLATRMDRVRATNMSATIGQFLAILFGVVGLFTQQWMLVFIAFFIYVGAQAEAQAVEMRAIFQSVLVRDAMTTIYRTLSPQDTLEHAADELLAGHQQDFPVVEGEQLVGMLHRKDLVTAISQGEATVVGQIASHQCLKINLLDPLDRAVELMQQQSCSTLPVLHEGRLVGLLTSENIGEWTMIQAATRARRDRRAQLAEA